MIDIHPLLATEKEGAFTHKTKDCPLAQRNNFSTEVATRNISQCYMRFIWINFNTFVPK